MPLIYPPLLAMTAFLASGPQEKEVPFALVDAAYGHDSSVTQPQVSIAQDAASWNGLWANHRGTSGATLPGTIRLADDRPPVDFKKNFVVAIFGGTTQEIEGYEIVETAIEKEVAYVRFRPVAPSVPSELPRVTQPYGFAILPRTRMKVQVQVPRGMDQWRTVAQFGPTAQIEKKKG